MKIAIDARWIYPEISGIGTYTAELIRSLAAVDRSNSYLILFRDPAVLERTVLDTGMGKSDNFHTRLVPHGEFSLGNQLYVPALLRAETVDVYHAPNYMFPFPAFPRRRRGRIGCVVTLHDLIPLIHPEYTPRAMKTRLHPVYRLIMRECAARADRIIAVSECSKRDILGALSSPDDSTDRVHTVYNGVSDFFSPAPGGHRYDPQHGSDRPRTIIYVGRSDPYKNLAVLIEAFAKTRGSLPFDARLALVGAPDRRYPEAERLVRRLGLADCVSWSGYLAGEHLLSAYRNADLLVHPSRCEGFGLQVLEAMACGTPVLCSNAAALTEVTGGAAMTVDPDDVAGFADGIVRILTDASVWNGLSAAGLARAAGFTWQRTARQTLEVYERAVTE